jgi:phosphoglycerol transferase
MSNKGLALTIKHSTFSTILRSEWQWWIPGAIFSFVLASILMTGWPTGLLPDLSYPYTYQGDGLSHSWMAQRAIEGWIFENPRSGYPFGSNFLDYPGSDAGNLLLLKILGILTGEYYSALNLFYLFSFPAIFISSFCSLRAIDLSSATSFAASALFAFLTFHFQRLGHLFYAWYFVAPIFFYFCFRFYYFSADFSIKNTHTKNGIYFTACFLALASFGVYYALFGAIVLSISAFASLAKSGRINVALPAGMATLIVVLGVVINIGPNLINKQVHGANLEVAVRSPVDAEIFGLKLMQIILPRVSHREEFLASITHRYNSTYPLINENTTASLGVIGVAGFALLFFCLLVALSGRSVDSRLSLLAMLVFVLFLFGTIGGLGALFSATISSSIRGWNRISVFIGFGSIAAFFIALQIFIRQHFSKNKAEIVGILCALVLGGIGLYDQTRPACSACNEKTKIAFEIDRNFIAKIEQSLPKESAVYQLPYMRFPEVAPLHRLHTYDLAAGFLHSKSLKWNYAGMKGRDGDMFYRALAEESIEKQVEVISRMGFSGIYIDRRGYKDNANELIGQLSALLGRGPSIRRTDGKVVFFRLSSLPDTTLSSLSVFDIMKRAGYIVDKLGVRYSASFFDGIDFTRPTWPEFVRDVNGFSRAESWGRWSDANISPSARIDFSSPLPPKFTLVLSAKPFNPEEGQVLVVRIGDQTHRLVLQNGESEIRLPIVLDNLQVDAIEFTPQNPVSPQELGLSKDVRKLGVGFMRLHLEELI